MILKHYLTGHEKEAPEGFSGTTFWFGFWVPLLRGDIARAVVFFLIAQVVFSPLYYGLILMNSPYEKEYGGVMLIGIVLAMVYGFVTGSMYNDLYIEFLKEKGYITVEEYNQRKNEELEKNISKNDKSITEHKSINIKTENQDTILMICYPEIKELIKNVNLADQESIKDFVYNINKIAEKINNRDENEKEKLLLKEELKKIVQISGLNSGNFKEIADKEYFENVKEKIEGIKANYDNKNIITEIENLYKKIDEYNQNNNISELKELMPLYIVENIEEPEMPEMLKNVTRKDISDYIYNNSKNRNKNKAIEELVKDKNKAIEYREIEYKYNLTVEKYQKNKEAEAKNQEIEKENSQILKENEEYILKLKEMKSNIEKEIEKLGMQKYLKTADVIKPEGKNIKAENCEYKYISTVSYNHSMEDFISKRKARKSNIKIAVVVGILVLIVLGIAGVNKYIEYQGYVSAKKSKDISNMSSFVKKYPNSEYKKEIAGLITEKQKEIQKEREKIEKEDFEDAKNSKDISKMISFIKKYPDSKYVKEGYIKGKGNIRDFLIGKYEVTQAEYRAVMGYNPSHFKGDNRPVESVTWYDAVMYCNKLSEKEKLTKYYDITNIIKNGNNIIDATVTIIGGKGYKLPTNEEWEYAAKGGLNTNGYKYAGSDDIDEVAWYSENSSNRTHEVGQKKANELGIYDMSGNVWEWNETISGGSDRYYRGGSWVDLDYECEIDDQFNLSAFSRLSLLGFRVCRSSR